MGTSMLILFALPVTVWIFKGAQFMLENATMVAGVSQAVYFVVNNI
jgi:hypothetical protein